MDATTKLAWSVANTILLGSASAPLRQPLIESRLGAALTGGGYPYPTAPLNPTRSSTPTPDHDLQPPFLPLPLALPQPGPLPSTIYPLPPTLTSNHL